MFVFACFWAISRSKLTRPALWIFQREHKRVLTHSQHKQISRLICFYSYIYIIIIISQTSLSIQSWTIDSISINIPVPRDWCWRRKSCGKKQRIIARNRSMTIWLVSMRCDYSMTENSDHDDRYKYYNLKLTYSTYAIQIFSSSGTLQLEGHRIRHLRAASTMVG